MQRRGKPRGFDGESFVLVHNIQLVVKLHLLKRADPPEETYGLPATAEQHMLAVVDREPCFTVVKRTDSSSKSALRLEEGYIGAVFDEFACAGDARYPAAYDCNIGTYGRPPRSRDLTNARAAMATLRVRGTEMEFWKTS